MEEGEKNEREKEHLDRGDVVGSWKEGRNSNQEEKRNRREEKESVKVNWTKRVDSLMTSAMVLLCVSAPCDRNARTSGTLGRSRNEIREYTDRSEVWYCSTVHQGLTTLHRVHILL